RHLTSLEKWLGDRSFVATDDFTVADIMVAHVLFVFPDESLFAPYPKVRAFRDACKERPAWKRAFERYCERVEAA
ncbi:MAG TPA: glutathione binding-like protein, partial [Polyangiaceae bacterium]